MKKNIFVVLLFFIQINILQAQGIEDIKEFGQDYGIYLLIAVVFLGILQMAQGGKGQSGALDPVEIRFRTSLPLDDVSKKIINRSRSIGGDIKVASKNDIVIGFGSQLKIRLLGAMLAGADASPRDVIISLKTILDKTEIVIIVRDTLGFGLKMGFIDKLQKTMYEDAIAIKSIFDDSESF